MSGPVGEGPAGAGRHGRTSTTCRQPPSSESLAIVDRLVLDLVELQHPETYRSMWRVLHRAGLDVALVVGMGPDLHVLVAGGAQGQALLARGIALLGRRA